MSILLLTVGCAKQSAEPDTSDNDVSYSEPETEETTEPQPIEVSRTAIKNVLTVFKKGTCWVELESGSYALIDTKGALIYALDYDTCSDLGGFNLQYAAIGVLDNGCSVIYFENQLSNHEFFVIDNNGNELFSSKNDCDENTKMSYVGVYKNSIVADHRTYGFSEETRELVLLDKNGKIIKDGIKIESKGWNSCRDYSEGMVAIDCGNDSYTNHRSILVDLKNWKVIDIGKVGRNIEREFIDGKAVVRDRSNGKKYFLVSKNELLKGGKLLKEYDDLFTEYHGYSYYYNRNLDKYINFDIPETVKVLERTEVIGGYLVLQLKGVDNHNYFVAVDKNGKKQYEPVMFDGDFRTGVDNEIAHCNKYAFLYNKNTDEIKMLTPEGKLLTVGEDNITSVIGKDTVIPKIYSEGFLYNGDCLVNVDTGEKISEAIEYSYSDTDYTDNTDTDFD